MEQLDITLLLEEAARDGWLLPDCWRWWQEPWLAASVCLEKPAWPLTVCKIECRCFISQFDNGVRFSCVRWPVKLLKNGCPRLWNCVLYLCLLFIDLSEWRFHMAGGGRCYNGYDAVIIRMLGASFLFK